MFFDETFSETDASIYEIAQQTTLNLEKYRRLKNEKNWTDSRN